MTLRLLRLWPEGMAGRLGLLLLAGFGLFALVAGLLLQEERSERRTESFARTLSVRVVAMVEALEVVPAAERGRLPAALPAPRGPGPGASWAGPGAGAFGRRSRTVGCRYGCFVGDRRVPNGSRRSTSTRAPPCRCSGCARAPC